MAGYKYDWQMPGHWFDYFAFFGISEHATENEIRKTYLKLAKKYHPDMNPNNKSAEENLKKVNIVYEILSDSKKRAEYYEEYKRRKQNNTQSNQSYTTQQNAQRQSTQNQSHTTQQNAQHQSTQNQSNNNTTDQYVNPDGFSIKNDILKEYLSNPSDKKAQEQLLQAICIVVENFKAYAQLVDETIRDMYITTYKENLSEQEYKNLTVELQTIILDQIKIIKEFKRDYCSILGLASSLRLENKELKQLIKEYKIKIKELKKPYQEAYLYGEECFEEEFADYFKDIQLLSSQFNPTSFHLKKRFDEIRSREINKTTKSTIENDLQILLDDLQKFLTQILEMKNIGKLLAFRSKKCDMLLESLRVITKENIEKIQILIDQLETLAMKDNILMEAEEFYNQMLKYNDPEELEKMILTNQLNESIFENLKDSFINKRWNLKMQLENLEKILSMNGKAESYIY